MLNLPIVSPAAMVFAAGSSMVAILPMVLIFGIFYLLIMLPQQKRQKKFQAMLASLKNGDRIVTSGGIRGTVVSLRDDALQIRVPPDNLRLEIARGAVVSIVDETSSS